MVWKFPKKRLHGLLITEITPNNHNPRCTTKIKTLNLSQKVPHLSRDSASDQMCSYRSCDYKLFQSLLEREQAMDELR